MFRTSLLFAVLIAASLAPSAHAAGRDVSPLPAGACATEGAVGIPYRTGVNCRVTEVDGHPRRFVVYVPRHRPVTGSLRPVVFMFHGSTGTGERFLRSSGWREQADATGLVAVFPTGLRYRVLDSGRLSTKWNSFDLAGEVDLDERPRGYPEDAPWPADDVGFVDSIMGDLGARLPIDRDRVYASGFSNGAGFAGRLAVERSRLLAAAAFSGGALPAAQAPARPIPMWLVAGALDDRILAHTGPPPLTELPLDPVSLLAVPVVDTTLDAHLATLGLDENLVGTLALANSTAFRWPAIGEGPGGGVFRFSLLAGLGHHYPHARNNDAGFEAAPEFWEFFRTHRLP
ncbi:MAG TPA: PHB depolymerase family esterase [Solirubrobacteraceae bacterium]|nr:PHB depolymerase family esterase [Solirubrobacteraceae bacterium]